MLKMVSYILDYIHDVYPHHTLSTPIYNRNTNEPYLYRHHLLLKERETFPCNIFIQKYMKDDEDDIHDHPWDFFYIVISEGYWEYVPKNADRSTLDQGVEKIWRKPGYFGKCRTNYKHRIVLDHNKTPWTIFISFKSLRIFLDLIKPEEDLFIKSICEGSPFTTILEFSPILVKNILI